MQEEVQTMRAEIQELQSKMQSAQDERNIFKLYAKGKSPNEIATELNLTAKKVKEVLNS